jgi:hypothetical protein
VGTDEEREEIDEEILEIAEELKVYLLQISEFSLFHTLTPLLFLSQEKHDYSHIPILDK